ncbi:choice-of-anchor B family protein [Aquimarina sp. TRL1]|uniref:choice-of-anchor B family protein n=1 Tax=Aquimarina sp. (strain TRL1) TaxID=2736252 RepID=UPI00158DA000|nr:choice-of-anchor B family protein [Aquimarina sp. TRL1]QKX04645.1 choice-of-anchor B family protein [Aquimarina sp. TRL1]
MKKNLLSPLLSIICILFCNCSRDDTSGNEQIIEMTNQGVIPCENGIAAGKYPCKEYDFVSHITLEQINAETGNDSWGWTDPVTNKEYALIGLDNGTAFIDISIPESPRYIGKLPTATVSSSWRDVKVYNNTAFIVSEAKGHGMQVFDLTKLRNAGEATTFTADVHYTDFGSAHNIVINPLSGYAYVVGAKNLNGSQALYNGGPLFINIQNPLVPKNEGGYAEKAYSHDAQVITYNGPDPDYIGKEILIGSNENELAIVDITDKSNPIAISTISYAQVGYTHQGWFTEDMKYFLLGDELDETREGFNTRTIIFNMEDLDVPQEHMMFTGTTSAIDHNGYVKGNLFYLANYQAGMRVIDISDLANKNIAEIGFFDTFPTSNAADFKGAWNVYPFFKSGNIVISDINSGFILVRKK